MVRVSLPATQMFAACPSKESNKGSDLRFAYGILLIDRKSQAEDRLRVLVRVLRRCPACGLLGGGALCVGNAAVAQIWAVQKVESWRQEKRSRHSTTKNSTRRSLEWRFLVLRCHPDRAHCFPRVCSLRSAKACRRQCSRSSRCKRSDAEGIARSDDACRDGQSSFDPYHSQSNECLSLWPPPPKDHFSSLSAQKGSKNRSYSSVEQGTALVASRCGPSSRRRRCPS